MFLRKLGKRGAEMVEYAIVLACIAAVGVGFYSSNDSKLTGVLDSLFGNVRQVLGLEAASSKYFTIAGMPIASSQYWNSVHGRKVGEAAGDEEGLQTLRTLAENMTFLIKSIALGKEKYGIPEKEPQIMTNFIK